MTAIELIPLPRATDAALKGPLFRYKRDTLVVDYDEEQNDGSLEWTRLRFLEVIALEFVDGPCCRTEDIGEFDAIQRMSDSAWRSDQIERWQVSVGYQAMQDTFGGAARFRHYQIYRDDVGALNILAEGVEIEEARDDLSGLLPFPEIGGNRIAVRGIVVLGQFAQSDHAPVVHRHRGG